MTKKKKTLFGIFIESIGLYFSNFSQFVKYMTFPVLGQILGLLIVFVCTLIYTKNLPTLIQNYPAFNNFNTLIFASIIITIPGLAIFMKAFWEYLVAYGAVNSMLENMLKSGKVYDFDAHTELIKRRTAPFVVLWLLFGIFSIFAIIPFFWVIAGILIVYFVLVFQVFTYEPELSPIGCVKKSFSLIKGHFASTFILLALAGLLTYVFIPQAINTIFEWTKFTDFGAKLIIPFISELPIEDLNITLANFNIPAVKIYDIALFAITTTIAQIFIQYTLPLRSILWGMWYKELNGSLPQSAEKKKKTSSKKRPSEKLMEESHKKFVNNEPKRLDRNILKRAMEKEDEEE